MIAGGCRATTRYTLLAPSDTTTCASPKRRRELAAVRVGDRVLYEGKTWRVTSLGREAFRREGDQMTANDALHAIRLLEADPPRDSASSAALSEGKWDEVELLEDLERAAARPCPWSPFGHQGTIAGCQ